MPNDRETPGPPGSKKNAEQGTPDQEEREYGLRRLRPVTRDDEDADKDAGGDG